VIVKLFEITDFIDKARWGNKANYNLINFYRDDLSRTQYTTMDAIQGTTSRGSSF